jgi:quercetin 2,3-dioxygenase
MIQVRKASERGHFNHGWLDTYHTFSFAQYYEPEHMGFRALRVINEDRIAKGQGFGMHGHQDMEIVTYVLEGSLEHKDSLGNGSVIGAGELQRMTAGRGVQHSEFNPSDDEAVHLYQIWLLPGRNGLKPDYEERRFATEEKQNRLRLVVSPDGQSGSLRINQDVSLYLSALDSGQRVTHSFRPDRYGWVQVLRGRIDANGIALVAGDGAAVSDQPTLEIAGDGRSELLLFDLN